MPSMGGLADEFSRMRMMEGAFEGPTGNNARPCLPTSSRFALNQYHCFNSGSSGSWSSNSRSK
jgi:hypothetical protein